MSLPDDCESATRHGNRSQDNGKSLLPIFLTPVLLFFWGSKILFFSSIDQFHDVISAGWLGEHERGYGEKGAFLTRLKDVTFLSEIIRKRQKRAIDWFANQAKARNQFSEAKRILNSSTPSSENLNEIAKTKLVLPILHRILIDLEKMDFDPWQTLGFYKHYIHVLQLQAQMFLRLPPTNPPSSSSGHPPPEPLPQEENKKKIW